MNLIAFQMELLICRIKFLNTVFNNATILGISSLNFAISIHPMGKPMGKLDGTGFCNKLVKFPTLRWQVVSIFLFIVLLSLEN